MRSPSIIKAHLALLTVNLIYGANYSIIQKLKGFIDPFALVLIRAGVTMTLFWLTSLFFHTEKIERRDFYKLMALGAFAVAINQLLFIKGLYMGNAINASIIMIFSPIAVILIEILFLKQKAPLTKIAGIIVGICGAITLLVFRKTDPSGRASLIGDILILINCISWSIYLVMVKPMMMKYKTVTIVKWVFTFGTLYVLPFGWGGLTEFNAGGMDVWKWFSMAYVVVGSTYFAYFLNTYALNELSASVASTYIYLQPVIASCFAIAMGQDKIDAIKIISALLIVAGIYLVSKSKPNKLKVHNL